MWFTYTERVWEKDQKHEGVGAQATKRVSKVNKKTNKQETNKHKSNKQKREQTKDEQSHSRTEKEQIKVRIKEDDTAGEQER